MRSAPLPSNELERLAALQRLRILDTAPEPEFDDLVHLAAQICEAPIAGVSLVDEDRQWFKAKVGVDSCQTSRDAAFCAHAILEPGPFVVPDARQDERFGDNPLVAGPPYIRFYAGVPLRTTDGQALGSLCVSDTRPRELTDVQLASLIRLARQVEIQLELRRAVLDLAAVTERQQRTETGLRSLLSDLPSAVFECDSRGWCTLVNERLCELTGLSAAEAMGTGWLRAIHPDDRTRVAQEWAEAAADGREFGSEYRYLLPDGRTLWIEGRSLPRRAPDGSITGFIGTAVEITARHQAEEARQQSELRLAYAMEGTNDGLWDWNIPSGAVHFSPRWSRMLGYEPDEVVGNRCAWENLLHPEDREMVRCAVEAHFRGETEFFRVEKRLRTKNGEWRWILARGRVVERDDTGGPLRMAGTHTDITFEREREAALRASEAKLRSLFELSPLGIALCEMDGRFVDTNDAYQAIVGCTKAELRQRTYWDITPAEYLPRQREWLREVETTGRYGSHEKEYRRPDGSRVAVLVDGVLVRDPGAPERLWIIVNPLTSGREAEANLRESEERFLLAGSIENPPLAPAFERSAAVRSATPDAPAVEPATAASVEARRGTGPRVLVVDDNSVNQKVAARMLGRLGCRVDVAANGAEAVAMVRTLPYAVVFMDCMMPEMDGYEATAAIRAMPGPAARTPIVAMTANAMQGDREQCLAAGMDDYLSKPVRQDQLQEALTRWAPDTNALPSASPVDSGVLEGFRQLQEEGQPDIVNEFIDLFLGDLPARREAILRALRDGDSERLRAATHALKSSAAYIGAAGLARLCTEVEIAARNGDMVTAAGRCPALEAEADCAAAFLVSRRGTHAG